MSAYQGKHRLAVAVILAATVQGAAATTMTVTGNSVQLTVSDDGTIGDGGTRPALIYDPSGTGTFDTNTDYVAPGSPHEGFGFRSDQTGFIGNNNNSSAGAVSSSDGFNFTSLTDLSGGVADNHLSWLGASKDGSVQVQHDFFFNDNDERVNIRTTLTALTALTGVKFSRAVDPDPDNYPGGSASTINQRGLDANSDGDYDDPGDLRPEDFVTSVGTISGRPLGLYSISSIFHNTGIEGACCSVLDPDQYLAGGDYPVSNTGDNGLGIAFDIGDLGLGDSIIIDYAYVMGESLSAIDIPGGGDGRVPAPAALWLTALGLLMMTRRRMHS